MLAESNAASGLTAGKTGRQSIDEAHEEDAICGGAGGGAAAAAGAKDLVLLLFDGY
jgi:hypothetical protein